MLKHLIFVILLSTSPLFALGQTGHRITGAIAEKYLSNNAKIEIAKLIGEQSLAEISTYVDEMRALKSNKFWSKTSYPYHYVTVPDGKSYLEVGAPSVGDAYTAINQYTKILKDNNATKSERSVALKFIVHLIGDLHQPLHVGNGFDKGGNDIEVSYFGRRAAPSSKWKYNLHSIWDSAMIDQKNLSYTEWTNWLSRKITTKQINDWNETNPLVWIKESYDIRQRLYPKDDKIDQEYVMQFLPVLKQRIQQAGVRIAAYLNEIYATANNQGHKE